MSDIGIVPVGFNSIISEEYAKEGEVTPGPKEFVSLPRFEFLRDPSTGSIMPMEGTSLLASKILYKLFTPIGSYAVDTSRGSFLEDLVGGNLDRASVMVRLSRSIQKLEDELKSPTESLVFRSPDEELDTIKITRLQVLDDSVQITLRILAQSGRVSSLTVGV